ncbi:IclR family transcriptional regulator [uncultured Roseovarius sp.]|uniref:IclR family transcriptional regulator n=1 Tax=uncultured Roseovarius sp. TaxID=293344 RepID=UPI002623FDB9|nr:IclR family transcriptional regulator [uncultured Roseovarius sp.]
MTSLLETVAIAGRAVTTPEIQQATGLPRPTCYRLLQSLAEHRLLDEPEPGRFLIGERLVRLALLGQTDVDASQAAAPTLREAADAFGEAVFLSRFRNRGVEIIHVETPHDLARSFIHPGLGFRPMHACSCSKVIAAFAEDGFREEILNGPMRSYTPQTKRDPEALRKEFAQIRLSGYAECVEEIEVGVSSVAAPIRIGNIGATFSIGATGPIRRFTTKRRAEIGRDLRQFADKVSLALQMHG